MLLLEEWNIVWYRYVYIMAWDSCCGNSDTTIFTYIYLKGLVKHEQVVIFFHCTRICYRQNPRNYTHVVNNGFSRSENLQGFLSFDEHYNYTYDMANVLLPNALIEEVARITKEREDLLGLEECYKKVCKVGYKPKFVGSCPQWLSWSFPPYSLDRFIFSVRGDWQHLVLL